MSIKCSAALKAHLARPDATTATCWLTKKVNGQIVGFTEHWKDLVFNLEAAMTALGLVIIPSVAGSGSVTFKSASGYSRTDIATSAALDVDNLVCQGPLQLPSLVRADVAAGLWDAASVILFLVNWSDLTMGALIYRAGTLGDITIDRGTYQADLLGVALAYQKVLGNLTSPFCRYTLGDLNCKVNMSGSGGGSPPFMFTVTSTLTGVESATRPRVLYDSARMEPGPAAGIAITNITQANPGVVTTAIALGLPNGTPINISGVLGMTEVNTLTVIQNPNANTFQLSVDSTLFSAYTGGGLITPLGGESGWFDNGVFMFTSGANAGLSMEIQSYVPGEFLLELPFPYPIVGNESYIAKAGCNKDFFSGCKDKYNNVVNFGGEPYVPGTDKLLAVGKQN